MSVAPDQQGSCSLRLGLAMTWNCSCEGSNRLSSLARDLCEKADAGWFTNDSIFYSLVLLSRCAAASFLMSSGASFWRSTFSVSLLSLAVGVTRGNHTHRTNRLNITAFPLKPAQNHRSLLSGPLFQLTLRPMF
jgi:hypothetical protein